MSEKYAFSLDIDNTLYCHGEVCEANRKAIDYVRSKGSFVFINTARSLCNVPEIVRTLPVDGFITSIGCSVVIHGEKLLSAELDVNVLADEFDFITEHGMRFLIEGEDRLIGNEFCRGVENVEIIKNGAELLEKYSGEVLPKVFVGGVLPQDCREYLEKRHTVFQHPGYAEYAVEGYSKASGMFFAAEKCGISKKNCVAMGDSVNDLTMLEAAGISVAMGNSADEIKAVCDIVTCDAKDGGVAEAMLKIVK